MTYSDDTLMAYADGELEAAERAAIEQAMRTDPAIAAAVERHRALRADVAAAFAGILDEPVPARLRPPAPVVSLAVERDKRRRWSWPEWGALAATLVVGVLAGRMIPGGGGPAIAGNGNQVLAQGELAAALDRQVGGKAEGAVKVGVSFAARDGAYCRGFVMGASAGLACREGGQWKIPVLAEAEKEAAGGYRQAGSALPPAVLDAIDARIADRPLDAAGEEAARARAWQPAR
ncbi:hypothetical protein ASD28_20585 [Massilia sp. Root133]|uniref:anti-sigma factor family protein n=1 Tax=unclassified Massilia TaxID=2609279 RepID=UPI000700C2A2|nr:MULTISPECIES: hypothetical protein [unclassified Massilia]KQY16979.1 hypothetical protein ASD28_20585 [Massilia sp. Root133]KQZ46199.1 hypothetical protein ASD92_27565 [Massilia sp. Root1485]